MQYFAAAVLSYYLSLWIIYEFLRCVLCCRPSHLIRVHIILILSLDIYFIIHVYPAFVRSRELEFKLHFSDFPFLFCFQFQNLTSEQISDASSTSREKRKFQSKCIVHINYCSHLMIMTNAWIIKNAINFYGAILFNRFEYVLIASVPLWIATIQLKSRM